MNTRTLEIVDCLCRFEQLNELISLFFGDTGKDPGRVRMAVQDYAYLLRELGACSRYLLAGDAVAEVLVEHGGKIVPMPPGKIIEYTGEPPVVVDAPPLRVWGMVGYVPVVPDRTLKSRIAADE